MQPFFPKKRLSPYHNLYHELNVYRVTFDSDAYMWTPNGLIYKSCVNMAGSMGVMWPTQDVGQVPGRQFIRVVDITDPVVSTLPMFNVRNYYHWIVEGSLDLGFIFGIFGLFLAPCSTLCNPHSRRMM